MRHNKPGLAFRTRSALHSLKRRMGDSVGIDESRAQRAHSQNDPALWVRSQREVERLIAEYGKPGELVVSRTRRVLVYEPDFVIKLPTSLEGLSASRAELAQMREQGPHHVVLIAPTVQINDDPDYPIIKMLYVDPMGAERAANSDMGMEVDRFQIGRAPRNGQTYAFDL